MSEIYRYEVPVDDQWHRFELYGSVVHVAARKEDVVEFWAYHSPEVFGSPFVEHFRVVGTGQPVPKGENRWVNVRHVGTALVGPFAWHLIKEVP